MASAHAAKKPFLPAACRCSRGRNIACPVRNTSVCMTPRKNLARHLPVVSTKFTKMIATWLASKTNDAYLRMLQMVSGGAMEIEPQREWIEPVETRAALGLSEDAIVIGHHLPLLD